ncbi:periplasmic heavy metal sensor [Pseudooctadecabacter sp.]|uniref:periplasmic heavy metal sensor n=1 Tax=Pseudooctadecabacter sp. TaxID=1966338 RepID=UPI0025F44C27|nr:periplasmic heavy metal sensor [Pseudooctadecabacter sp.]
MSHDPRTSRNWTKVLLVASLALNLLIVGAVIGVVASGGTRAGPQRFDLTAGPLTRAMEAPDREAVRQALRDSGAFRPSNRRDIRADMGVLIDTVRSDTFDAAAFRAALMRQRDRLQAGQVAVIDAVAAQIEQMSPEDRAAFADRLENQLRRGSSTPRQGREASSDVQSGG